MPTATLTAGSIHYESAGPADGAGWFVFVHGYAMAGSLWKPLSERLAKKGLRCIAPTWPLGSQPEAMHPGADVTVAGVARMVGELLARLELEDVVLVGNDTGGLLTQIVAGEQPERLGGLVLTSCDAFEHFPPPILKPFMAASRSLPLFRAALMPLGTALGRRRGYAKLAHCDLRALAAEWTAPALHDRAVAEDLRRFTASMERAVSLEAARRLSRFTKPALVAWSADDEFFPLEDGQRLAQVLPNASFEVIEGARTFSMLDQPEALAGLIGGFASSLPQVHAQAAG